MHLGLLVLILLCLAGAHAKKKKGPAKAKAPKAPGHYQAAWEKKKDIPDSAFALPPGDRNWTAPEKRRLWAEHCLSLQGLPLPSKVRSGNYTAVDFAAQFRRVRDATNTWLKSPPHTYAGYSGPWDENHFYAAFGGKGPEFFEPLIPVFVPWMDNYERVASGHEKQQFQRFLQWMKKFLHKDWLHVTLSGTDYGIGKMTVWFNNLIVLSSGGFGHIPIPLMKAMVPRGAVEGRGHLLSSVQTQWKLRAQVNVALKSTWLHSQFNRYQGKGWKNVLRSSQFCMAIRGNSRTSFHMYEALQAGCIPVYVYDDLPWLPYRFALNWSAFSIIRPLRDAKSVADDIARIRDTNQTLPMLQEVHRLHDWFTFKGLMYQIGLLFSAPENTGLACQKLPPDSGAHYGTVGTV